MGHHRNRWSRQIREVVKQPRVPALNEGAYGARSAAEMGGAEGYIPSKEPRAEPQMTSHETMLHPQLIRTGCDRAGHDFYADREPVGPLYSGSRPPNKTCPALTI